MGSLMRVSLIAVVLILSACEDAGVTEAPGASMEPAAPSEETVTRQLDPCETTTASYETVGEPFMRTWCTPCHHTELDGADRPLGSESVNLDTYALVTQHLDRIEARALGENPTMPPGGGPSEEELERVAFWLECGAVDTLPEAPPQ